VLYQPAARVVHDEGTSSGTDTASGAKAFQPRNRERFAAHRRIALARHAAPGTLPTPAMLHRRQRQVLVVDVQTPHPDRDSASLRLFNLMRMLRDEGAHVVFLPADLRHEDGYTQALQQIGVEAWYAPHAGRVPAWLREHGPRFERVLLCRHYVASEFLPLVRRFAPQARVLFDTVDLHYLRERRAAELGGDPALLRAALRTRRLELDLVARSDVTLVVSEAERALLRVDAPHSEVEVLSNLHDVAGAGLPFAQRGDLVFVGGFRHPPNADAARWFIDAVFPRVRAALPGVRFHCIGGDVPPDIRERGDHDGVVIHGHVADIAPYMDGCRISVAPLRFGAGVKGKVNLAMAHGQPVVATGCAVEGMHLVDGRDVLVADDADGFAAQTVRLYRDQALWGSLAQAGLENVRQHFSLDAARGTVRRLFLA
jgi:glycosyltransferase involved in cell wall biosynthesis